MLSCMHTHLFPEPEAIKVIYSATYSSWMHLAGRNDPGKYVFPTVLSHKSASAHFNKIDAINAGPITLILMTIILIFIRATLGVICISCC